MYYYKQVLMWISSTLCERGGTNQEAQLLWPLVATVSRDITECPSLLWLLVETAPGDITECPSLLWPLVAMAPRDITECPSLL
jgi:hypothetical protein